jgi:predicted aldo/keto reductase-like oxidoreductase
MYLIHAIRKQTWDEIKQRKIIEEYEKFKAEGLIRGIGFSYHGLFPAFSDILSHYSWDMCQIQQNFLDTQREATEEAIGLAGKKGCALVIMEPLRGGSLAVPPKQVQEVYDASPVKRSPIEWGFRHLINYPEVSVILSGVSTLDQLKQNIEIFSKPDAVPGCLSQGERDTLALARERYWSLTSIPCTACEYCLPCPQGVTIPGIFNRYNGAFMFNSIELAKAGYANAIRKKQDASLCVKCGACEKKCPQSIDIISKLQIAHAALT